MKNNILTKISCFAFIAAALIAAPAIGHAQEATNAPATTPAPKKHSNVFRGTVAAVDATAMTFTVGNSTAVVSSTTKISKDGKPAVFSDITVGATVACSYKKDEAGKLNAVSVKIGEKKKKEAATPAPQ
jgi:hypothetical protein